MQDLFSEIVYAARASLRGPRLRPFGHPRFLPGLHGIAPLRFAAAVFALLVRRPRWAITSEMSDCFIALQSLPTARKSQAQNHRLTYANGLLIYRVKTKQPATKVIITEIKRAIARSISHNEIVLLTVDDPKAALEAIDNDENVAELDWTEKEIGLGKVIDVWGKRLGQGFRLYIASPVTPKTAQ